MIHASYARNPFAWKGSLPFCWIPPSYWSIVADLFPRGKALIAFGLSPSLGMRIPFGHIASSPSDEMNPDALLWI